MIEIWKPVPNWEGLYEVSNHGQVRSLDRTVHFPDGRRSYIKRGRILGWRSRGYARVVLVSPNHDKREAFIHELVLEAFVGSCPDGWVARHADDNKQNNHLENLSWGTYSENMYDRVRNGIHPMANKTHCKRGHPFDEVNTIHRPEGGRFCRECTRMHKRESWRRRTGYYERVR